MKHNALLPPGKAFSGYLLRFFPMLILVFLVSLQFISDLSVAREGLYELHYGKKVLIEGAKVPPLNEIWEHSLLGFWGMVILAVGDAVSNYRYFFTESRSIYLMRRLPDRLEFHRRCLSLPLLELTGGLIFCLLLAGLFILLYLHTLPASVLPEDFTFTLWRAFS